MPMKKEIDEAKREVKEKTITLVLAGFGLVAALAWNDAVQTMFRVFFPKSDGVIGKFVYAVLVTIIVVILSLQLKKIAEKTE